MCNDNIRFLLSTLHKYVRGYVQGYATGIAILIIEFVEKENKINKLNYI